MNIREELRIVVISLDHEMSKLEEFFEEVPIVDLYFLEMTAKSDSNSGDKATSCNVDNEDNSETKRCENVSLVFKH